MPTFQRKTYKINASGIPLGRLASRISLHLSGKNRVTFERESDHGDIVMVENAKQVRVSGKKMESKVYLHHTKYLGGLKSQSFSEIFQRSPQEVIVRAVYNMLPKTKHRKNMMKRLIFNASSL
jgi:large subunit ribosomal protein L13